jgi:cyclic pyranopterin phosphate synthase
LVYASRSVLYRFDGIDETLGLLPLSARRALDHAGRRLSREGWTSLPVAERLRIVELGAARTVDVAAVCAATALATPGPADVEVAEDAPSDRVPDSVRGAFGTERPLTDSIWASLAPLDRYVLTKVATRENSERLAAAYAEIVGSTAVSTHLGPNGGARMVDVGEKLPTLRRAVGRSTVTMSAEAFQKLRTADVAKGDVLGTARVAGIMGAKRTADLIPLCHPIALSKVTVEFELEEAERAVQVVAIAEAVDRTGVEMEALVAASVAALTIYDMLKGIDRAMVIGPTLLLEKSGGRSGDFSR